MAIPVLIACDHISLSLISFIFAYLLSMIKVTIQEVGLLQQKGLEIVPVRDTHNGHPEACGIPSSYLQSPH